jgi:dTDP-6-deoxy-L-talose 4-dehydrogenase (NAD+)
MGLQFCNTTSKGENFIKVLITGATGFIGNCVVEELLKRNNYDIITTSIDSIERAKEFSWFNKVEYIECNLNESNDNYYTFFKEPDILIHLAWQGLPNFKELFHFESNLMNNYNFLKNIIKNGLKDVNVIGTCLEYGLKSGCLSEELDTQPNTAYGLAKDTLRKFIEHLLQFYNFSLKWIRLFFMYGKGQTPKSIIPQLEKALENNEEVFNMSGGEQLRDYLPVENVAKYIVEISIQKDITGIINCCSGKPITIKDFVVDFLKQRNKSIKLNLGYYPYPDYVPMAFWGDNTKLMSILKKKK